MFKYYGPQLIFLTLFALLLELTVVPLFQVQGAKPDLFFILLAFYAFFIYPARTPHFAVFLGLVRELFSGSMLGLETIAYGLSGLMLWLFVSKMERENLYNQGAVLFSYSLLNLMILGILTMNLSDTSLTFYPTLIKILSVSIYTCFVGPFLFEAIRRFLKMSPERDYLKRSGSSFRSF